MSDHRRRIGLMAAGAVSLALIAGPLTAVAQDGEMAMVSEQCQAGSLEGLRTPGRLTVSTDNPSFPPWWGGDPSVDPDSQWEVSYPPAGEGVEGSTVFGVARALGFDPETDIDWVQNAEFTLAFQPGPKPFDIHLAQVAINPDRAQNVDFSVPYFRANQSLVVNADTDIAGATSIDDLKDFSLGAAVGTTSLAFIENDIQPNTAAQVFNDNAGAIQALDNGQIDGIIVDVGTAFFVVAVQLSNGTIVGQFPATAQENQLGMVLELDSPLTDCINEAVSTLEESGELQAIYDATITAAGGVPVIE